MTERRFSEAEVAAIFERAAHAQHTTQPQMTPGEGMTLADLQQIGREVGIAPELVAQAATALERAGRPVARSFLGLPIGVGRTIELGRELTDAEWERLVVDLRDTFDARGTVRQDGALRQWTNGNLQALLEPGANGHRLRLRTLKGDARSLMTTGLAILGVTVVMVLANLLSGSGLAEAARPLVFGSALGLGMFGAGAIGVPAWARLRARQMEEVAARLTPPAAGSTLPGSDGQA